MIGRNRTRPAPPPPVGTCSAMSPSICIRCRLPILHCPHTPRHAWRQGDSSHYEFAELLCIQNRASFNRNGKLGHCRLPREETARIPKSNRMPDALHGVKVETQVVDGI